MIVLWTLKQNIIPNSSSVVRFLGWLAGWLDSVCILRSLDPYIPDAKLNVRNAGNLLLLMW